MKILRLLTIILTLPLFLSCGERGDTRIYDEVSVSSVPDTGQIVSYTATWGEDNDYTINSPSYTDTGNGTITDNVTGLTWQKQDDDNGRTWDDAISYCSSLNLAGTGWRLPTDYELTTIADFGRFNPATDTAYFPNTKSSNYWSNATFAHDTSYAYAVTFRDGCADFSGKTYSYYVRCVR